MTLYTSKVIAQWLCLTERRVRQLRDEGVIVEARPGLYELQPTVARYIKYLGGAGKESLNTERMKLTAEKRKAAEMDNDLRRGDLHSTQDIEKGIQTMCLNIRSRFLAMLEHPEQAVNTPLLAYNYKEAVAAVGYHDDFAAYTLCESISAAFSVVGTGPLVLINVLDPAKHTADIAETTVQVNSGVAVLDVVGVLLDKLTVKSGSTGALPTRL